jgi:hypothetical protein
LAHRSLWQKTCMHYQWKMNSFKRNVNYSNEYCLWETRIALSHLVPCRLIKILIFELLYVNS